MMSAWNLLWIVPVSCFFGILLAACLSTGREDER